MGIISTFSWGGQIFFYFSMPQEKKLKNWKKQHFICSNLTLFIVPFFLFSLFLSFFFFFLFPWGWRPPAPLKWHPCGGPIAVRIQPTMVQELSGISAVQSAMNESWTRAQAVYSNYWCCIARRWWIRYKNDNIANGGETIPGQNWRRSFDKKNEGSINFIDSSPRTVHTCRQNPIPKQNTNHQQFHVKDAAYNEI